MHGDPPRLVQFNSLSRAPRNAVTVLTDAGEVSHKPNVKIPPLLSLTPPCDGVHRAMFADLLAWA